MKIALVGNHHNFGDEWGYVLNYFDLSFDDIYCIGSTIVKGGSRMLNGSNHIDEVGQLPPNPLVVLSSQYGRKVQGTECLCDFEHPEDPIYLLGADDEHLQPIARDHVTVYIPGPEHTSLYAHVAAAIALYDRVAKNG